MKQKNTRFDYINFAYGTGAAIVIIGAMFKFLGWDYANEFFLVGLTTEAVVFLISAFEYKNTEDIEEEKEYRWENVFPELLEEKNANKEMINALAKFSESNASAVESVARSLEQFGSAIATLNTVTSDISKNLVSMGEHVQKIEATSASYANEVEALKESMKHIATTENKHAENLKTLLPAYEKEYVDITEALALMNKRYRNLNETFDKSSSEYEKEFGNLVLKMSELNSFYTDMLQAAGRNR